MSFHRLVFRSRVNKCPQSCGIPALWPVSPVAVQPCGRPAEGSQHIKKPDLGHGLHFLDWQRNKKILDRTNISPERSWLLFPRSGWLLLWKFGVSNLTYGTLFRTDLWGWGLLVCFSNSDSFSFQAWGKKFLAKNPMNLQMIWVSRRTLMCFIT